MNPALKNATFFGWWIIESTATNTGGTTLTDFKEYTIGIQGGSSSGLSGALLRGNNLSDLLDTAAARTNLGAVAEAPVDGVLYGRKDAAWEAVPFPRLKDNTVGASYTLQDSQHGSRNLCTAALTITLEDTPANMIDGFLSFHVNTSAGEVVIDYDAALVSVLNHDKAADPALKIRQISVEPSKGGVQIDYIGFNISTSKMEYHVYGALV